MGSTYFALIDFKKALLFAKRSLKMFEESNSHVGIGSSFELLGLINYSLINFPDAIEYFKESLEIFIDLDINHLILNSYYYLGSVYYHKGELHQALDYMNKLAPYIEKYNDDYRVAAYLLNLVPLISENGDYDLAQKKILQCIAIFKKNKPV
ncbi:MAG: tetratricopeptide repeat protein [Candidatus Heimdallarchaeota archaeon]|nr:tetratricopeptide repeat protein [Candidatus Heimdallarchaeota archaeon]MBY8993717.1 tetratricopeptide repeat protein [Candidatus Heimdallarchaeota archaeon]